MKLKFLCRENYCLPDLFRGILHLYVVPIQCQLTCRFADVVDYAEVGILNSCMRHCAAHKNFRTRGCNNFLFPLLWSILQYTIKKQERCL